MKELVAVGYNGSAFPECIYIGCAKCDKRNEAFLVNAEAERPIPSASSARLSRVSSRLTSSRIPDAVGLFKDAKGSADILMRLSTITNVPMIKGDTLIFFDEVQDFL